MRTFLIMFFMSLSTMLIAQTGEDVVNKYLEATNLKGKIDDLDAFQCTRQYKSSSTTEYSETIAIQTKDSKYYKKKSILDRDFYYILNGGNGFIKIPVGSRDKTANFTVKDFNDKEKTDYQNEVKDGLLPFYNAEEKGYTVAMGSESVDGQTLHKLSLERAGVKRVYLFDKNTGLLSKESWTVAGVTHTFTHIGYKENPNGVSLPVDSQYINTKDNKVIRVSTSWELENPSKGVSFTK